MKDDRGEITEITMSISYPDGTKKTVSYDQEWISNTGAILIHESCMTDGRCQHTFRLIGSFAKINLASLL